MGISRLSSVAARTATVLPLLIALSACATAGGPRPAGSAAGPETASERGPRVQIWTTDEFDTGNRIRASFRLEEDAYVIVVNVGRDGYANVIFPESPDDDGFMRGRQTYRLPAFFPGFARHFPTSQYARLHHATSVYDNLYDRYAGYVFIIASWRPMHFQVAEALGLWDDYRLAAHEEQLEPYAVMHRFADRLIAGRSRDYTARFARYAAFERGFPRARSFASCTLYGPVLGYFPSWVGSWWVPIYGLGYYGAAPRCGFGYGNRFAGSRPFTPPIVTPPVKPTPTPGSDTATKPRQPRRPRTPVAEGDTTTPKVPRGGKRVAVAVEDEPIVDVTRESRDVARRRGNIDERVRRALDRDFGYERSDTWSRSDRSRRTGRTDADTRARARDRERAPVDHDSRGRADNPRNESRGIESRRSEPRREPPAHSEPRSEPRQEARPQPAPRNDPPPRSEPAARPEPRGERPVKPDRQ